MNYKNISEYRSWIIEKVVESNIFSKVIFATNVSSIAQEITNNTGDMSKKPALVIYIQNIKYGSNQNENFYADLNIHFIIATMVKQQAFGNSVLIDRYNDIALDAKESIMAEFENKRNKKGINHRLVFLSTSPMEIPNNQNLQYMSLQCMGRVDILK